ncbi:WbqC family protein [Solibacillus sp. FSL W8-0474]|uniref:WbqC family protein n=1 Tax=Solibacillus sp. FSL W8-0474 TaxID=2975336 RepID=UPI0030F920EF
MKLAIMQPYFFPYIGYFSLMQEADQFIIFDTVQFQRKSWMVRNCILNLNGGSSYIHLPVKKAPLSSCIKDIYVDDEIDWKEKLFNQLQIYKKAPYFTETIKVLEKALNSNYKTLTDINKNLLVEISNYLNLKCKISVFSEMELDIEEVYTADEWALNISKKLNATEYINAPGGVCFFDREKYENNNIKLKFIKNKLNPYKQFHLDFVPGLSIIDVIMFNSINKIHEMLVNYEEIFQETIS